MKRILKSMMSNPLMGLSFILVPLIAVGGHTQRFISYAGPSSSLAAGSLTINGTVGQAESGFLAGSAFSMEGGFWAVVETFGPMLTVRRESNSIVLGWSVAAANFKLQRATELRPEGPWVDVTDPPAIVGGEKQLTIQPVASSQFYRLIRP